MPRLQVDWTKRFNMRWDQQSYDDCRYLKRMLPKAVGAKGKMDATEVIRHALKALADHVRANEGKVK